MNPMSLVLTVVGGLLVAGLLGWIRKPRLTVLVPRTFAYSQITDRGHLVEISVFNRGFKTEEAIDVVLNPHLTYEFLGSNSQGISLERNTVQIKRIGPSDEATILLIVEGGPFSAGDITQTVSKETKGKTVSKLEEVPPTGPQRIALIFIFVGIPLLIYSIPFGLDLLTKHTPLLRVISAENPKTINSGNWRIPSYAKSTSPRLYADFIDKRMAVSLGEPVRKGDIVKIPVKVTNNSDRIIKATASMTTVNSEKRIPSYDRRFNDVVVLPGKMEERSIPVVIPEKVLSEAEKIVFVEIFLEDSDGDSLSLKQEYPAK